MVTFIHITIIALKQFNVAKELDKPNEKRPKKKWK